MKEKTNKTRDQLAQTFISALNENTLPWVQGWRSSAPRYKMHESYGSGKKYRGVNALYLWIVGMNKGYQDHRWCTFNQIKEMEWHLKKDSKGAHIEYWYVWDTEKKVSLTFAQAREIIKKDKEREKDMVPNFRNYVVFNGDCIDGIPQLEKEVVKTPIFTNTMLKHLLSNYLKNAGVAFGEHGSKCFYSPTEDKIYLPPPHFFISEMEFYSTALHECAHSTGHERRLKRDLSGSFGTESYAKEELRAEIASAFVLSDCGLSMPQSLIDNNKAYIQSWIKDIKDKPNELFQAIKEADTIGDFVCEKGYLLEIQERKREQLMVPVAVPDIA